MSANQSKRELTNLYEKYLATPKYRFDTQAGENEPRTRESIADEFCEIARIALRDAGVADESYKKQIQVLYELCERNIESKLIAETIGCSIQHARRFTYDDERGAHRKAWADAAQNEKVSPGTRTRILDRDDGMCLRCRSADELEVHHILPVSRDGTKADSNLATLCTDCHRAAHNGSKTVGKTAYEPDNFVTWLRSSREQSNPTVESDIRTSVQRTLSEYE